MYITDEDPTYLQEKLETAADEKIRALRTVIQAFRMEAATGYDVQQLVRAADLLDVQVVTLQRKCKQEIAAILAQNSQTIENLPVSESAPVLL